MCSESVSPQCHRCQHVERERLCSVESSGDAASRPPIPCIPMGAVNVGIVPCLRDTSRQRSAIHHSELETAKSTKPQKTRESETLVPQQKVRVEMDADAMCRRRSVRVTVYVFTDCTYEHIYNKRERREKRGKNGCPV